MFGNGGVFGKKKPPSPPPPPPPVSPDGAMLMAGITGSLRTTDGLWTFSAATGAGGNFILLNGFSAAGGSASQLGVANQGKLYAQNNLTQWFLWNGTGWTLLLAPPVTPAPLPPLVLGFGGPQVTMALQEQPDHPNSFFN